MTRTSKFVTALASLALASALAGCTAAPQSVEPTPTPTVTQLPAWAQGTTWLIYPDGFECWGTEGCPNSYRASFGEPPAVLPANVVYYDPAKHDCVLVQPADVTC